MANAIDEAQRKLEGLRKRCGDPERVIDYVRMEIDVCRSFAPLTKLYFKVRSLRDVMPRLTDLGYDVGSIPLSGLMELQEESRLLGVMSPLPASSGKSMPGTMAYTWYGELLNAIHAASEGPHGTPIDVVLHPDEARILGALANAVTTQSQYALEAVTRLSRRTISGRLTRLRKPV